MWHTTQGELTIRGPEAELVRESIGDMVFKLQTDEQDEVWEFGVARFDSLNRNQKLAVLLEVAEGLLLTSRNPPELTAVVEAAVMAVYENIMTWIEIECEDAQHLTGWRKDVLAACRHVDGESDNDLLAPDSTDLDEWRILVEVLADHVLWDRDFEFPDEITDVDPEKVREWEQRNRIPEGYFSQVAPDPPEDEAVRIEMMLRVLCGYLPELLKRLPRD